MHTACSCLAIDAVPVDPNIIQLENGHVACHETKPIV